MKEYNELFKYLYAHKGTVGTIIVTLEVWSEFGFLSAVSFLGIVLMVCGGIATIAKAMD